MSNTITKQERDEAIARLRELLPPGSTVHTILRHVSRSGMSRSISCVIATEQAHGDTRHTPLTWQPEDIDWLVRRALGLPFDRNNGGLKVNGCGMDMGFHLVYSLSRVLYPNGFDCTESNALVLYTDVQVHPVRCPSNDHSNYRQAECPTHHNDGGYALKQRWL